MFYKSHMTTSIDATSWDMEAVVGALGETITKEDTRFGVGLKLVRGIRVKPRVAKSPKDPEFGKIRRRVVEFRIRAEIIKVDFR